MNTKYAGFVIVFFVIAYALSGCGPAAAAAGRSRQDANNGAAQVDAQLTPGPAGSNTERGGADDLTASATDNGPDDRSTPSADDTSTPGADNSAAQETATPGAPNAAGEQGEFVGAVESINGNQWTIGGQVFTVTNATEFKDVLKAGDLAKVHVVVNPDGTVTIIEIEAAPAGATPGWDDNGQHANATPDDHGLDANATPDDHGQDASTAQPGGDDKNHNGSGGGGTDDGGHGGDDGGNGGGSGSGH